MSRPSKLKFKYLFPFPDDEGLAVKRRRYVPHEFVLEAIASLSPWTRPMFGCLAVYVKEKIVLILRDTEDHPADNGVWLATIPEHHESLRRDFPMMRSIQVLGKRVTGWQVLPVDAANFEESALRACEMIIAADPRIGKLPGTRRASSRKNKRQQESLVRVKKAKRSVKLRSRK
jgi:hypothetical protein